ncbi:hypothetical protein KC19_10G178000 [Ceratodon purpureus]|uniref:Protein SMG9 n=1 Tax=Ceratodon purpureus TaxID=3225 RepID=A0A8T0GLH8_CERPU|nr:hypothetical protein KC19_10G178000 [Ceratodon purpureus]
MATSGGSGGPGPKILLAKPAAARAEGLGSSGPTGIKLMRDRDDDGGGRRIPPGSLNLLSDTWDLTPDRYLPLMSADNQEFMVVGVLGPPGAGKSTILNEIYGFDSSSQGVLPPFNTQTEDIRATARHCSVGLELRMCAERIILLDTQPIFSASVLVDLMRPDGTSNTPVMGGETMSAELAQEIMGLQLGVFLFSVCHVVLLITEGVDDISMWRYMRTIEMLKQGIPDPSVVAQGTSATDTSGDKDRNDSLQDDQIENFADAVFVHTKLQDISYTEVKRLEMALSSYFPNPAFNRNSIISYTVPQFPPPTEWQNMSPHLKGMQPVPKPASNGNVESGSELAPLRKPQKLERGLNFYVLPLKVPDEVIQNTYESYYVMLQQLRNQILSLQRRSFAKPMSERDWLKVLPRVWDLVKKSPVLADYFKMLQSSGLFRR